jgi:hypothetical protein
MALLRAPIGVVVGKGVICVPVARTPCVRRSSIIKELKVGSTTSTCTMVS